MGRADGKGGEGSSKDDGRPVKVSDNLRCGRVSRWRGGPGTVGSGATAGRASDWVLVLLYGGAVSALSQMSQPPIPPALQFSLGTLTLHAIEFGGFAFLLSRAFGGSYPRWSASRLLLVTVAVTAGFAVADEVHQYFVPGRHCEATDAFADVVGATIVAFLQAARQYKRRSRGQF